LDYNVDQRLNQDFGGMRYVNEHPFPPTMPFPSMHEQLRPQPGRNWTQEVWVNHGEEVPVRTESPPPIEAASVTVDNADVSRELSIYIYRQVG
jgi:hypothetical protein